MQTMKGNSEMVKFCFTDKVTLAHVVQCIEKEFDVQWFDDAEKNAEDVLIVGKK